MNLLRRSLRLPGALVALATVSTVVALLPVASASAQQDDLLTEEPRVVKVVQQAGEYVGLESDRCSYASVDGAVDVACRSNGLLWLDYAFTVPAGAINLRVSVGHELAEGSDGTYVGVEGLRTTRSGYRASVNVGQGTAARIEKVRLRYELPTVVDDRPCVTDGEWAAVNPAKGGFGGTRSRVATVFDHPGSRERLSAWAGGFRYQVRGYQRCDSERVVRVTFHQYRGKLGWHSYWG